jgi:pimeloyl-ACP methyl ester carboxylesterase
MTIRSELPDAFNFAFLSNGLCHYQIDGPDQGPRILLIHGATVPAWEFDRIVPYLTSAGFQTIRADLLGHGYSDRPDVIYDVDLFREQLIELLNFLNIDEPVHILGHSLGAAIGAALISHYPERFSRLILAAPLVNFQANMPAVKLFKVPMLGELLTPLYVIPMLKRRRTRRYGPIEDGRFVDKFHTQFLIPGFGKALLSLFRDGTLGDQSRRYRSLHNAGHECLILRGSEDDLVTSEQIQYLRTLLPAADAREIKGTAHAFMLMQPELVAPEIIRFLSGTEHRSKTGL